MTGLVRGGVVGSALLLGLCFVWAGSWPMAGLSAAVTLAWGWSAAQKRDWGASLWLAGNVGLAAWSALAGAPWWLALAAVGLALAAWDVVRLQQQMGQAARVENQTHILRLHLRRLSAVIGLGVALGGVAASLRLQFGLGWAIALGLIVAFSLSGALQAIRHRARD